jgi:activator of HSP90 ATPase
MWTLLLNRYVLGGLAIAALIGFLAYEKHGYDNRLRLEGAGPFVRIIQEQKAQAKALLDSEIAKNAALSKQWAEYARKADDDYAKQIADIRARGNSARGVRLYDAGCGQSSSSPATGKDSTTSTESAASTGELSSRVSEFLVAQATRADELYAYALACHRFVNSP